MQVSDSQITIRRATADDAVLISALATTTFFEAYFVQDESANLAAYIYDSFKPETLRAEIAAPDSRFFIISVDSRAVGYAKTIDNSRVEGIAGEKVIEIKRIYIVERFWGTGAGKTLLKYCIADARERGFEQLWLGVWEENTRAQRFYLKFGFEQVGTVTFPYGEVEGTNLVLSIKL